LGDIIGETVQPALPVRNLGFKFPQLAGVGRIALDSSVPLPANIAALDSASETRRQRPSRSDLDALTAASIAFTTCMTFVRSEYLSLPSERVRNHAVLPKSRASMSSPIV
jgi:hypothetical protein